MINRNTIAILGAGSWGTAIAIHLARFGHRVLLWGRDAEQVRHMKKMRQNTLYLPGFDFPETLETTSELSACFSADHLMIATPSHAFKSLLLQLPKNLSGLSWITKGIDPEHYSLLSELVFNYFSPAFPVAIISGPSFAKEVAQNLPTAIVVASPSHSYANTIRSIFQKATMRTYITEDIIGVQLCGAIKNVLAIACGISDGLEFGSNAKAALITRGLAEMTRLGLAFHADPLTFTGLAGIGDLVLTCTDNQSRNRRFGLLLGQGLSITDAEKNIHQVVEGKYNAHQVCTLAKKHQIDMPICEQVNQIIMGKISAKEGAKILLERPLKSEI